MDSMSSEGGASDSPPQRTPVIAGPKTRVRTGCLVCRRRKVKCDEKRPSCQKCIRLKRICTYKTPDPMVLFTEPLSSNLEGDGRRDDQPGIGTGSDVSPLQAENGIYTMDEQLLSFGNPSYSGGSEPLAIGDDITERRDIPTSAVGDASLFSHNAVAESSRQGDLSNGEASYTRFLHTSRHISQTLAMDWLGASEAPTEASFSYFIEKVDCPLLSPFDCLNWERVKTYIAQMGAREMAVATGILAVQALYRAQADRLPMAHGMSIFAATIAIFDSISASDVVDFDVILVVAFLLCLSVATMPNEDGSTFGGLNGAFISRLETWLLAEHQSPVSLRICAWLQLLNTATKRAGTPGILSETIATLLYNYITEPPNLSLLDCDTHPENALYDIISAPIFNFYLQLQSFSNQVADLSHYRRSRTTPEDQAEVSGILTSLKTNMCRLWEARPGPLRLECKVLQEHFGRTISDPLISLVGICSAAYFTELIVMGRILGDPPSASPEAQQAMTQIRSIVECDQDLASGWKLNPGYVRPLFMYAIECLQKSETEWAVDRLRKTHNPISRSDFVASLAGSLGDSQRNKGRRVTTKAFCYQTFGVTPPFM